MSLSGGQSVSMMKMQRLRYSKFILALRRQANTRVLKCAALASSTLEHDV